MNPLWFIPAVMSVFGGLQEYKAGKEMDKLGKQQALMAEENAMLAQRELDESIRREEKKNARLRSSALAKAAASGFTLEGTTSDYLAYMESEQQEEIDWMRSAGASRIRMELQSGKLQAKATRIQAKAKKSSLFTSIAGSAGMLAASGLFSGGGGGGGTFTPSGSPWTYNL